MSNGHRDNQGSTILPYHFVPVEGGGHPDDISVDDFHAGRLERLGHHRFVEGGRSGRIVCRLTTESPTFIGAERRPAEGDEPAGVDPFELAGRPAVPASSLRGMLSSIAEAASSSALRVLDERSYSYRAAMKGSLSAIGEVIVEDGGGEKPTYRLRPLTLPTLKEEGGKSAPLPRAYHGWFETPRLKVYVGGQDSQKQSLESYRQDAPRYYGLKLREPRSWGRNYQLLSDQDQHRRGRFLLAQRVLDNQWAPRPWDEIPETEKGAYTRGIVRVMRSRERREEMPNNRKHEIFLPYPEDAETWKTFPIAPRAVERFHELSDERTAAHREGSGPLLPFEPVGTVRNLRPTDEKDRTFRLKTGDLVYFRPSDDGEEVAEIALSSIWRERVEDGNGKGQGALSFFGAVDPELLPFHPGRRKVTLAEQLFGFASSEDPADKTDRLPALKSHVRFADARLDGEVGDAYLGECTLKILDSPKPPSPSLYFHDFGGHVEGAVSKEDLKPGEHRPQGRKFYVHQVWEPGTPERNWPWRTHDAGERSNMKTKITPLRDGLSFTFHLDYDNLSDPELGLLLYALRPTEAFRHKIGMGKPIGLGSVRLDVIGVLEVDRQSRYRAEGLFAPRYGSAWVADGEDPSSWPESYERESRAVGDAEGDISADELREGFRETIPDNVRNALERLGEESFEPEEVSWPRVEGGNRETKTFEWFVSNDRRPRGEQRSLRPIQPNGWPRLPILQPPKGHRR